MKVIHVITGLLTGGAQMTLYKLLAGTNRNQFEPVVISLTDQGTLGSRIMDLDIPVHRLNMKPSKPTVVGLKHLITLIRSLQPDVIQGWMYHANLTATLAGAFTTKSIPILWNIRHTPYDLRDGNRMTSMLIRLGAPLSRMPARIIYNSNTSATRHQSLGYQVARQHVLPNGFDLEQFSPSQDARQSVRDELGLRKNTPLIGIVARYHPMKDHHNFLQAASILVEKQPDAHFVIIGRDIKSNTPLMEMLNGNKKLKQQTHLLGERRDVPRLNAALDIASSASAWGEAFPNVIGEAMACGVPCVVTDVGDSAWIVGDTGRVVPPRNPQGLARAWEELLCLHPDERQSLGLTARQRIEDQFSVSGMVHSYEHLYKDVVAE